jgi:hypothetical protein
MGVYWLRQVCEQYPGMEAAQANALEKTEWVPSTSLDEGSTPSTSTIN